MDTENGFAISPELAALRDQVGKIIRDEIIPIEARIDPEIKGTWGAYDLEWIREMWLRALQRGLEGDGKPAEELF